MPSIELVRFVSSGTEATMSASGWRARVTGRDTIVKFAGCYHGHADALLVEAGSGARDARHARLARRAAARHAPTRWSRRSTTSRPSSERSSSATATTRRA